MQINGYNSQVSQRYLEKNKSNNNNTINSKGIGQVEIAPKNAVNLSSPNSSALINTQERDFFKTLFPESSDQIDKHIVFNRNGKVSAFSLAKGVIVDNKA